VPLLTNAELARIFHEIGDMLEVQGELVFKTVAYHRAADAIEHSPVEVARAYREGHPPRIEGVGEAISKKLQELADTGHLAYYEQLRAQVPPSLVELLQIPGVGPRTVKLLHDERGIETLDELRHAAQAGHLRDLRGMSERTEAAILDGIAQLERRQQRMRLGQAERIVGQLVAQLGAVPGVRELVPAGSFRRRCETIGDLDLLASTDDPDALVGALVGGPAVDRVLASGSHKASVRLRDGPQVDLMVMPPGQEGSYLVHFTGSKAHNVHLRSMARERGWSLSEKGFLRLDADGEPAAGEGAELRTFPTEAEVYAFLDLAWMPPELREDRGEIEAAAEGRLPHVVELADLRGDCHTHSDWSDGVHTIEQMAEAARARGYAYQVLTDHTYGLAIARGLTPERVPEQRAVIAALNERFAREAAGDAAAAFRLLHGCELEIRADATLDFPDEILAGFDLVVAALHLSRRQPRAQLMARVLAALRSPHVDILAHPAGRVIGEREDLDLDWEMLYAEAARTGTILEINSSDHRLDLSDERARRAAEAGCLLAIDSDAHRVEDLDQVRWGVAMARRGWVEPGRVVNTWPLERLLDWAARKAERLG
jgi:DNA polymerase (family 10)